LAAERIPFALNVMMRMMGIYETDIA